MAARRARRAFSSRIRFLSSSFLCCCSRRLSSSVLSSHSFDRRDADCFSAAAKQGERQTQLILRRIKGELWDSLQGHIDTFLLLSRMRLSAAWLACRFLAWCLYQRWIVTAAWFTCWINLQIHKRSACGFLDKRQFYHYFQVARTKNNRAAHTHTVETLSCGSDLSASSSVTSLLRSRTGLPCWADTGDLLLEAGEAVEKFFWDLVREPLSSDTSSFAVAFKMLLKEKRKIKNFNRDAKRTVNVKIIDDVSLKLCEGAALWFQDILERRLLVGALRCERLLRVVIV